MVDSLGNVLTNTAHDYMECSNKGICDRTAGNCVCFAGYEGSACQRASCPSNGGAVCSGFGTCETIETLVNLDSDNSYLLWDKAATMGCLCDPGYSGPDCSLATCKYGADPLYHDNYNNIRYTNITYEIYTTTTTTLQGNYSLIFTDIYNKAWSTEAISITGTCDDVTNALESLPNNVVPVNSVRCYQFTSTDYTTTPAFDAATKVGGDNSLSVFPKFTLVFAGNPGAIPQIGINKYLDGDRPTLYSSEVTSTLGWHIFTNGFIGEDTDVVPDLCEGVLITLSATDGSGTHVLQGLTPATERLLKTCLGDSDGNPANNVEVYNWDYGNASPPVDVNGVSINNTYANPHLIKLIDASQDPSTPFVCDNCPEDDPTIPSVTKLCASTNGYVNANFPTGWCQNLNPPGFYAVLYYNGTNFNIFTRAAKDYAPSTPFHIFTTTGYLQRVSPVVSAVQSSVPGGTLTPAIEHTNTVYLYNNTAVTNTYYGGIDCVANTVGVNGLVACVNKDDTILLLNVDRTTAGLAANPAYPNLYAVEKIGLSPKTILNENMLERNPIILNFGVNTAYTSAEPAAIYKFFPPTNGYKYVDQCAGRGLCDNTQGSCQCFSGYTGDACTNINALAL